MLKLCAAQLRQYYPCRFANDYKVGSMGESVNDPSTLPSPPMSPSFVTSAEKRFAWIDIGGGTGENIERMNQFFPIRNFDRVYVVDITPSLCKVAEKRFERLGWTNVKVLCLDASKFEVPIEDEPETLDIALVTLSYSLSMMETFFPLIDRLTQVLSPSGIIGLCFIFTINLNKLGIADFYVSHKRSADPHRQLSWIMRWFWSIWFDFDNIYLHPCRRDYLEHSFRTIKSLNCKNHFIGPLVKIPYYVWLGAQKEANMPDFQLGPSVSKEMDIDDDSQSIVSDENAEIYVSKAQKNETDSLISSEHIHGQGLKWRRPFDPSLIARFKTYIYAFAWEDPKVDLEFLDLNKEDTMMIITSGGCNLLEYAASVGPKR